ncbi:MAG: hypothetical protein KAS93_02830 [Gammaproteobacteria bacterium]|nr:hypothetical protein [Gammaproteobacteria bacterium]
MKNKQTPPYGRELKIALQSGAVFMNDLFICVGKNAWNVAKGYRRSGNAALIFPEKCKPSDFDWSVVKHRDVLVIATQPDLYQLIRALAYELLSQGKANIVRVASITGGRAIFRRYGDSHA